MNNSVEENAFEVTFELVKTAKIKINSHSLRNALLSHPYFPSLAALSDVLDDFNVPNLASKISNEQLFQIPLPALAHLNVAGGSFVMITDISEKLIEWKHNTLGNTKESLIDFVSKWDGVTLLIEPNENSGELDYEEIRKKDFIEKLRTPFIIIGLLGCLAFLIVPIIKAYYLTEYWQFYGFILSKLCGTGLSIMLVWYALDINNSFLSKVCHLNKNTNCQNILNSKASNIGGVVSWSDVGLIYYLGGLLSLLFFHTDTIILLQIISFLALPYTFWSVYYQAFKAKIWCPLCLCVQALLWIEFVISLPISVKYISINIYLELAICVLVVATLLSFVKKHLKRSLRMEELDIELQKLKFNPDFVQSLLSKETHLPLFDHRIRLIEMGNSWADAVFTLVINPMCEACRQKFLVLENIVVNNAEVKYEVVLSSSSTPNAVSNQVTKTILGLSNEAQMVEALHDWFMQENQNFDSWLDKWQNHGEKNHGELQRQLHHQWITEAGITHTPIIYFNKVEVPQIYNVREALKLLKYNSTIGFRNQK